jgi:hypothetical protein
MSKSNRQKRYDKVVQRNFSYPWHVDSPVARKTFTEQLLLSPEVSPATKQEIRESFLIDATPVSDYMLKGSDQEDWRVDRDFPHIAPPYSQFFLEFTAPDKIISKEHGESAWGNRSKSWAILGRGSEIKDIGFDPNYQSQLEKMNIRWALAIQVFMRVDLDDLFMCKGPLWQVQIFVTDTGQAALFPDKSDVLMMSGPCGELIRVIKESAAYHKKSLQEETILTQESLNPIVHTGLLTLSFLHCKNVTVAVKKSERRYSGLLYHDIDIKPMRKVLKTEGREDEVGSKNALSICRGHFRNYEEGRGLFGKHHGTYWVDWHARGKVTATKD